jgi:hypothetical protein
MKIFLTGAAGYIWRHSGATARPKKGIDALIGSEKPLIHTSGSSIVYDDARGDFESRRSITTTASFNLYQSAKPVWQSTGSCAQPVFRSVFALS